MKAAQQVHRVRQVARAVGAGRFKQAVEVRMARAAITRDAGKLRFGNADRRLVDRAVNRHSFPLG
jgi:hypothetical protein